MLAMADEAGIVHAAVPGLSRRAGVSLEEARKALGVLTAPDAESRSPEFEGRRIEAVDGGWRLLNYEKYREIRTNEAVQSARRMRKWREKQRNGCGSDATCSATGPQPVAPDTPPLPQAEAEADSKAEAKAPTKTKAVPGNVFAEYIETFRQLVGSPKPGRICEAVKECRDELGDESAHALWTRWCQSDKTDYGPQWFGQNWRKAAQGNGATRKSTQHDRNMAVLKSEWEKASG